MVVALKPVRYETQTGCPYKASKFEEFFEVGDGTNTPGIPGELLGTAVLQEPKVWGGECPRRTRVFISLTIYNYPEEQGYSIRADELGLKPTPELP